jgi:predicted peptidase
MELKRAYLHLQSGGLSGFSFLALERKTSLMRSAFFIFIGGALCLAVSLGAETSGKVSLPDSGPAREHASFHKNVTKSIGYDFVVQKPSGYGAEGMKFPLIVFLHGSGECGHDLSKLEKHSLLKIASQQDDFPFVIVAPQMPAYDGWWSVESLDALLDHVLATYAVDPDRVYLTGLSLGAYGVWDWACHRPKAFAAIVPIAGEGNDDWADKLKDVPVWAFHGAKDQAVSAAEEQRIVDAVNKRGGSAKLTLYPDLGHNAWDRAYSDPALFEWLLAHSRKAPAKDKQ